MERIVRPPLSGRIGPSKEIALEASPKSAPSGISLRFHSDDAPYASAAAALDSSWAASPSVAAAALSAQGLPTPETRRLIMEAARFHLEASRHFGNHGPLEREVARWLAEAEGRPFLKRKTTAAGMEFTFLEESGGDRPFQIAACAEKSPAATLAAVLSTAWIYSDGVQNLLPQLCEPEGGQGWEEAAEWEKLPDGTVALKYLQDEVRIPALDFTAAVRAMAEFHLDVARTRDVDGPLEKLIRDWLEKAR